MSENSVKKRSIVGWLIAAAVLGCGIALFILWRPAPEAEGTQSNSQPLVETAQVEIAPDALFVTQTAFVTAVDSLPVVSEVSGRIASINPAFAVGSTVSLGDILFQIVPERYQADVDRARAQLRQAEAQLEEAEETLSRQRELEDDDFASEAALQGAQTARAQAQGNLDLANAQLATALIALDDTDVVAPFDAVVTSQSATVGQFIQAGNPVGEIAVDDDVEVKVGLTERQFATVSQNTALIGRSVTVIPRRVGPVMSDMEPRSGIVRAVSPVLDADARTVEVTVRVPREAQGGPALQFNQLVQVGFPIPSNEATLLRAPRRALQRGRMLWQVTDKDTLSAIEADIARQTDDWVYFTADIATDARVLLTALDAPVVGMQVRRDTRVSEARE